MKFSNIKQFPNIYYKADIPLNQLEDTIIRYKKEYNLNFNPDFQRDYVWTIKQKISYIEYLLKNPTSGLDIYFNHPNWMSNFTGEMVLVDGKQRLTAILDFINNIFPVYGYFYKEYTDNLPFICLHFNISKLQTRKQILQWYLDFNTGGTYHTETEIQKVKYLLSQEKS
jgi:uncharacterized protein with ParB-like and HNH nuclease domain